ncbi:MAG: hypothetical protein ABL898_17240 [Hyphomicrobiaceae bacterium]|nr:hypothetical protein [Hyphomicrobiaceae bacterium]
MIKSYKVQYRRSRLPLVAVLAIAVSLVGIFAAKISDRAAAQAAIDILARQFVEKHKCRLAELLRFVRKAGDGKSEKDRFLIVNPSLTPEHYVQCLFADGARQALCEAASGAYRAPDDTRSSLASIWQIAELQQLGFQLPSSNQNFQQRIGLPEPNEPLEALAELYLKTLFYAYGARENTALTINAPFLRKKNIPSECRPLS